MGVNIHINDTKMNVEIYGLSGETEAIEEYDITWELNNNIPYLSFFYDGSFLNPYKGPKIEHGFKKYIVLHGSFFLFFYNEDNRMEYSVSSTSPVDGRDISIVSANTELRENNIIYKIDNIYNILTLVPWVEGVLGSGIGERIRIEVEPGRRRDGWAYIRSLAVSNGFVDYKRPHLYENNNRLKKIRVHNIGYDEYRDFNLDDTPNIQSLPLGFNNSAYIIEIEILEVYKGTRWDDTCVNFIIPIIF
jgi:hypothetical protein